MTEYLEIDGSFGEGGGAILRLSAGLAFLFNCPIKITKIRANRPKPGLRTQHLLGLRIITELTKSQLSECNIGSEQIMFIPNPRKEIKNQIHVNINTAASIGLLLQPVQIASLGFKKSEKIKLYLNGGGTFGKWAPSLNYLLEVTFKLFNQSGLSINTEINRHGFYPKGGAQVICTINPSNTTLNPISLTELGTVDLIQGEIIITKQLMRNRDNIGTRIRKSIKQQLKKNLNLETEIKYTWVDSTSPGVGLSLWAHSDTGAIISTGTILGERKISSEELGKIAADEIIAYLNNDIPVDNYLSDQLIPLMGFIKKPSRIRVSRITSHTQTNLKLVKLFTQRDYLITKEKNSFIIEFP